MDFFRKNLGLLIYSLACLILAVVIALKMAAASSASAAKRTQLEEQLNWFRGIAKDDIKLTKENERAAQDNRDRAERKFAELRRNLAARYRIEPRNPSTEVEAVRMLRDEIIRMNRLLDAAEVDYSTCAYLSFEKRATSTELPTMEDVPRIYRQLRIVQEAVRIVAQSGLLSLGSIERPMELEVIEGDLYTATPIRMTVSGTAEKVQEFVNRMTTEANYLFFLRNLSVEGADQAPSGALGGAGTSMGGGYGGGMMDSEMGMEGMDSSGMGSGGGMRPGGALGGFRPRPRPESGSILGGGGEMVAPGGGYRGPGSGYAPAMGMRPGMSPEMGMSSEEEYSGMGGGAVSQEPMYREDLRVFMEMPVLTAQLRFDVIEFNPPDEGEAEE
ncbi:MAG: Amuc_1100 family pilus-like protein [Lentisphaeria bacterium]|nr:Amuc_1100 family pilus-like protein [Lentisphaeria bacterium]